MLAVCDHIMHALIGATLLVNSPFLLMHNRGSGTRGGGWGGGGGGQAPPPPPPPLPKYILSGASPAIDVAIKPNGLGPRPQCSIPVYVRITFVSEI